jgi:hypothetical protein
MAGLTPAQQAAQKKLAEQKAMNTAFMRYSYEQPIPANAQNGNAYGQTLNFDVPIVAGAFLSRLRVKQTLSVDYTEAATSPTATLNACGQEGAHKEINVTFGNKQITVHPYFVSKVFNRARGRQNLNFGQVLAHESSSVQGQLYSSPTLNAGSNTWTTYYDLPMTLIHPLSVYGLLPISGSGTRVQVQMVPVAQFVGPDPLENVVNTNGTITVTGTITVVAYYRDNVSMSMINNVQPDLTGLPTAQIIKPQEINPLTGGSMVFKRLSNPYPFVKLASVVIDGNSSATFCSATNITGYEIDKAENSSSAFVRYDQTTGGMANYFADVRERYLQDFDDGVIVWDAPSQNTPDSTLQEGDAYLNLTQNGYPAARLGFQVGDVSTANNITPRVVTYGIILNSQGIKIA